MGPLAPGLVCDLYAYRMRYDDEQHGIKRKEARDLRLTPVGLQDSVHCFSFCFSAAVKIGHGGKPVYLFSVQQFFSRVRPVYFSTVLFAHVGLRCGQRLGEGKTSVQEFFDGILIGPFFL